MVCINLWYFILKSRSVHSSFHVYLSHATQIHVLGYLKLNFLCLQLRHKEVHLYSIPEKNHMFGQIPGILDIGWNGESRKIVFTRSSNENCYIIWHESSLWYTYTIYVTLSVNIKFICTSFRNRQNSELFRPVSQRVQMNFIFNDNVRILCLSCNVKKVGKLVRFKQKGQKQATFLAFHKCCQGCLLRGPRYISTSFILVCALRCT
jgi:hypothetical protein